VEVFEVNQTLDPATQMLKHHDPNWTGDDVDFNLEQYTP
jgi:hypothetical protein